MGRLTPFSKLHLKVSNNCILGEEEEGLDEFCVTTVRDYMSGAL